MRANINLTPQKRSRIHEVIINERNAPRVSSPNFNVSVGARIPRTVLETPVRAPPQRERDMPQATRLVEATRRKNAEPFWRDKLRGAVRGDQNTHDPEDGKWYLTMNATKDALKNAPGYKFDKVKSTWDPAQRDYTHVRVLPAANAAEFSNCPASSFAYPPINEADNRFRA